MEVGDSTLDAVNVRINKVWPRCSLLTQSLALFPHLVKAPDSLIEAVGADIAKHFLVPCSHEQ